jgi:cysteinyl-tRNA synthetase
MQLTDIDPKIYQKDMLNDDKVINTDIFFTDLIEDIDRLQLDNNFIFTRVSDFHHLIENDGVRILESPNGYSYTGNIYLNMSNETGSHFGLSCDEIKDMPIDLSKGKIDQRDIVIWNSENFYLNDIRKEIDKIDNYRILTSGIPGWHFQDYEIIKYVFNGSYDMHGGARELLYPHHEFINEISNKFNKFISHKKWIHAGLVNIKSQKMSNSIGNTILIADILKKYSSNTLKIFFLSYHYTEDIEFAIKDLEVCEVIDEFIAINLLLNKDSSPQNNYLEKQLKVKFINLLNNSYNTGSVIKLILETLYKYHNSRLIKWMLEILGLRYY